MDAQVYCGRACLPASRDTCAWCGLRTECVAHVSRGCVRALQGICSDRASYFVSSQRWTRVEEEEPCTASAGKRRLGGAEGSDHTL